MPQVRAEHGAVEVSGAQSWAYMRIRSRSNRLAVDLPECCRGALRRAVAVATACSPSVACGPHGGVGEGQCDATPAAYEPELRLTCIAPPSVRMLDASDGWTWMPPPPSAYHQVLAAPIAVHLSDDNGDGSIGRGDALDLVFSVYSGTDIEFPGQVIALSGTDGSVLWSVSASGNAVPTGGSGLAAAPLAPGGSPLVIVASNRGLLALDNNGEHAWLSAIPMARHGYGHPAIGDIDGDGYLEVAFGRSVVRANGDIAWIGVRGTGGAAYGSFFADLDQDGRAELIAGNTVYNSDGSIRHAWDEPDGWPAAGDVGNDLQTELFNITSAGTVFAHDQDGQLLWQQTIPGSGGGPPSLADFDGDGRLELAVAGYNTIAVFDGDGTVLWTRDADDQSSGSTGNAAFDFDADGYAEVVYADESSLRIFDGLSGSVQYRHAHKSITAFEYPILADLDHDGSLELVWGQTSAGPDFDRGGLHTVSASDATWTAGVESWRQHALADDQRPGLRAASRTASDALDRENLRLGQLEFSPTCDDSVMALWVAVENSGLAHSREALIELDGGEESLQIGPPRTVDSIVGGGMRWVGPWSIARGSNTTHWRIRLTAQDKRECPIGDRVFEFELPAPLDW